MRRFGLVPGTVLAGLLWAVPALVGAQEDALERAGQHLYRGNYAAVLDTLAAPTPGPAQAEGWRLVALAEAARGNEAAALAAWDEVEQRSGERTLEARVARAELRLYSEQRSDAWRELEAALDDYRAAADLPGTERLAVARAAELLAVAQPALFQSAVDLYQAAVDHEPGSHVSLAARVALGDLLLAKSNNEEALEAYREALRSDAEHAPAMLGVARSLYFDHSPTAAEAARAALALQPSLAGARLLLARMAIDVEDYAAAREEVEAVLAETPNLRAALDLRAALAFLDAGPEALEQILAGVRERWPYYVGIYETLAEIAGQQRLYREALEFALVGVTIDEQAWRARALLGLNRLRLGDMGPGRRALESAFRGDPFNVQVKNTLDLLDLLGGYAQVRSRHFELIAEPARAQVLAAYLLPLAEAAYEHFAERYDYRPPTRVRIEVYSRHDDFSVRTVGLVGLDLLGVSFGPVVLIDALDGGDFNWGSVLWHEIAHTFHLGLTGNRVPRWFSEGLAVHEEHRARPGWGADIGPDFLGAYHGGQLRRASQLGQAFLRPAYPQELGHAYLLGGLLVGLIEREHGVEALRAMLQGYRDGRSTEELFAEVLQRTPQEIDALVDTEIQARFGDALAGLFGANAAGDDYRSLWQAGRAALEAGELEQAESRLLRAQALFPGYAGLDSPYYALAEVYVRKGEPARAIEQLVRAIGINADDLRAHRRLAELYEGQGRREEAREVLERALLIQPFEYSLHARLAGAYEQAGDWPAAVRERAVAMELEPEDPLAARYHLARALNEAERPAEARRELLRTLEQAPLYEDALELLLRVREQLVPPDA